MKKEINWGILSTAKIGRTKVIPAIQQAEHCAVQAIASRSSERVTKAAKDLNIPTSYSSYEELLSDPDIQAVYNPLPNHLHVPWTIKALEAGKHVLCEKPIALNADEAIKLYKTCQKFPDLKVMEAFMYRFHPQWQKTKELVDQGRIGKLETIDSFFSYYNADPENIRNKKKMGGGGLMDIGCYCISLSRFLFEEEPTHISGFWKIHPEFGADQLASGVMQFPSGQATFTCATQTAPHQQVNVVGQSGRIVIEIPFNAPPQEHTSIFLYSGQKKREITFPPVNQYQLQAEAFARSIIEDTPVPTPLQDAIQNMEVIDAYRESAVELKVINIS